MGIQDVVTRVVGHGPMAMMHLSTDAQSIQLILEGTDPRHSLADLALEAQMQSAAGLYSLVCVQWQQAVPHDTSATQTEATFSQHLYGRELEYTYFCLFLSLDSLQDLLRRLQQWRASTHTPHPSGGKDVFFPMQQGEQFTNLYVSLVPIPGRRGRG